MKVLVRIFSIVMVAVVLAGCAAGYNLITKRKLNVQTQMSNTIFLQPVAQNKKIVYVDVHNTSGYPQLNLVEQIKQDVINEGFRVTEDPKYAQFILQVNVLKAGKTQGPNAAKTALDGGVGGALVGGATGYLFDQDNAVGATAGALAGAAVGALADSLVQDVDYMAVADVQVSQKTSATVKKDSHANLKQGSNGFESVSSVTQGHWNIYQTRVVSSAEKVNLKFDEAAPAIAASMSSSIAGIL